MRRDKHEEAAFVMFTVVTTVVDLLAFALTIAVACSENVTLQLVVATVVVWIVAVTLTSLYICGLDPMV